MRIMEEAKAEEVSQFPGPRGQEIQGTFFATTTPPPPTPRAPKKTNKIPIVRKKRGKKRVNKNGATKSACCFFLYHVIVRCHSQYLLIATFDLTDKMHLRKCTVFPCHPWGDKETKREGIVLRVPQTMDELIQSAQEHLKCSSTSILSEDGGRILDVGLIFDNQKLYLVTDQDPTIT